MGDKFRGHNIEETDKDIWVFSDNKEPVAPTWEKRPCGHCGLMNTTEGYDGCIGHIDGALNACCGHGIKSAAYIQFQDKILTGEDAINFIEQK